MFDNALHEVMSLLGGSVEWFTVREFGEGITKYSNEELDAADVSRCISQMLRKPAFALITEDENELGFYRKVHKGAPLLQVRRPGQAPDISRYPGNRSADVGERFFSRRLESKLPDDLVERLKEHLETVRPRPRTDASASGTAVSRSSKRPRGPPVLPTWVLELETRGAWRKTNISASHVRFSRLGHDPDITTVVFNVTALAATSEGDVNAHVAVAATVFGHTFESSDSSSDSLQSTLRALGEAYLCPGVGKGEISPYARQGYDPLMARAVAGAVRDSAADLFDRPATSFVIGFLFEGVLERTTGAFDSMIVPNGPRFRSNDCSLVDRGPSTFTRRLHGPRYCESCGDLLRQLMKAAEREKLSADACKACVPPSKFTKHAILKDSSAERVALALSASSARAARAQQQALRARAARITQSECETAPASSEVSQKLFTSVFEEAQNSADFEKCFPAGSVRRYVWDDQMNLNRKVAAGKSNRSFR